MDFAKTKKENTGIKTKEELNALKEEVEALNKKLAELSEEELGQVVGGITISHGGFKQVDIADSVYVGKSLILQGSSVEQFEGDSKKEIFPIQSNTDWTVRVIGKTNKVAPHLI